LLICDDVIDGGRTFIELANWFTDNHYTPVEINLYATHGIFSKGKEVLLKSGGGGCDNVWCTIDFTEYK